MMPGNDHKNLINWDHSHPSRSQHDHLLLLSIIMTPLLLAAFIGGLYLVWGAGPVIIIIPWFTPMFSTFVALTSLSVAFLAFGRYRVLADPISYWISLTFAAFGIGLVFYILIFPGLLPDGSSFIQASPATAAWISAISTMIVAPLLAAAALSPWPSDRSFLTRQAVPSFLMWMLILALGFTLLILNEQRLPALVLADGSYTLPLQVWNGATVILHLVGIVLSARRYWQSRDHLIGFIAFFQIALVYTTLLIVLGTQRYDLWWYLSRVVLVAGCLVVLTGVLSEYAHLFRRVRDSELRYRQLTESLPQLIWTARPDGYGDYLSPQWISYTGVPEAEQLGLNWLKQVHPDDRQSAAAQWTEAFSTGNLYNIEYRLRRYDGAYRWHKALGLPIRNAQEQIVQWFGSCTDIEDQKQVEKDLRDLTLRLERSNRDLQDFAFVASHDLQEPLRKIEMFGDALMVDAANLTQKQSEFLTRMRHSAARMRRMVHGLLQLSRLEIQAQPYQPVDLNQVSEEALKDLEVQVQQAGAVVEICDLPTIEADPQQMHQLFQNLLSNALKFRFPDQRPHIHICSDQPDPDQVFITFEDNGIGFEMQYAERLFEPFKRLVGGADYEGSGIGLAICRKIVERHHGEITVNSKTGQGSVFTVALPVKQAA
jgi:PAS domain S-box-containing protein